MGSIATTASQESESYRIGTPEISEFRMLYALDVNSGKEVSAEKVEAMRWSRRAFRCPCCRERVHLRAGRYRAAHFAHDAGVGTPECENFHPASDVSLGDIQPGTRFHIAHRPYIPPLRPFPLYLRVEDPSSPQATWTIALLIPQFLESRGRIVVLDGIAGEVTVLCYLLQERGRRIELRLSADPYRLRASDDVAPALAGRVAMPTSGFATDTANVFRYTESGGRRLESKAPIYWGRGYYVVWPNSLSFTWPSAIWSESLKTQSGWRCARVELPVEEDAEVVEWAAQKLGREVERPPIRIELVSPVAVREVDDDVREIPAQAEVILAILGEHGSKMPESIWVTGPKAIEAIVEELPSESPVLLRIGKLPVGTTSFELQDEAETTLQLRTVATTRQKRALGTMLRFRRGEVDVALPLFSVAAENALGAVRDGQARIVDLEGPVRHSVTIRSRAGRHKEWIEQWIGWNPEEFAAAPSNYGEQLRTRIVSAIAAAVGSPFECEIDFGSNGRFFLAPMVELKTRAPRTEMPRAAKRRIEWILTMRNAGDPATMVRPTELDAVVRSLLTKAGGALPLDERTLLSELADKAWPRAVLPQLRALAVQLKALHSPN